MITNIDENFGRLDRYLKKSGISENTILIFLSDNGTQFGYDGKNNLGYNMGYRDNKSDKEEGGHRVPFLLRWPAAGIHFKRDINLLTAHVDIIPTLAGLCNLEFTDHADLDGIDFSSSILDQDFEKPERTVFIHHRQDWRAPDDVLGSCIMKDQWRLIDGNQLYDVEKDPMQTTNLVSMHKAVAADLLNSNAKFIEKTKALEAYKNLPRTIVGSPYQQEVKLTIQHAIGEDGGIWKSEHVALGIKNKNNTYAIDFETAGKYKVSCRRWPKECPGPILGIPETNPKGQFEYKQIKPEAARIKISNNTIEQKILVNQLSVDFEIDVKKGPTMLQADFIEDQETYGVYYIYISKQDGG